MAENGQKWPKMGQNGLLDPKKTPTFFDEVARPKIRVKNDGTRMGGAQFGQVTYGSVTKGGGGTATGYLSVQKERGGLPLYHVGGACVGTTYMGSPRVDTYTLCVSCIFYQKKSCF